MAVKLIRLTHKIAIQLLLVAEICTICSSCSRNFWIHPRSCFKYWEITLSLISNQTSKPDRKC